MIFETLVVGQLGVNCYILSDDDREALLIDPGADYSRIKDRVEKLGLKVKYIVLTHGHYDHIGAVNDFKVPVYAHADEVRMLKDPTLNFSVLFSTPGRVSSEIRELNDGDELEAGGVKLRVIHTPGHSPGGICLKVESPVSGILFSGDTLFKGSVGRTDFPGTSTKSLMSSITSKLMVLPDETVVYPGHGPKSSIGWERKHNPFLR